MANDNPNGPKNVTRSFQLPADLERKIKQLCEREHRTFSQEMRRLVAERVERAAA